MDEKNLDSPELTKFVGELEHYGRRIRYATIMAAETIRMATIIRGAHKQPPSGEPRRRFYGYGHTYTEAVLNAYKEVHSMECHDWVSNSDQCVICDLLRTGRLIYRITEDDVRVSCGNFNGHWIEG